MVAIAPLVRRYRFIPERITLHAEELAYLWQRRRASLRAPDITLPDFTYLQERIEAHLQGLLVAGDELEAGGRPGPFMALANVLALAKFGHFDDLLSKSGRDYSYVCKTGKFEVLSSDSTYFSYWLSRSAPYVQETAALSSQGGEVFNSIGESDLHVDLCVAIEPIAISGLEFLTENYEYHHENLMNGEIECVSACINLNDAFMCTIDKR